MGFSEAQAKRALKRFYNNINAAMDHLLSGAAEDEVEEDEEAQESAPRLQQPV